MSNSEKFKQLQEKYKHVYFVILQDVYNLESDLFKFIIDNIILVSNKKLEMNTIQTLVIDGNNITINSVKCITEIIDSYVTGINMCRQIEVVPIIKILK